MRIKSLYHVGPMFFSNQIQSKNYFVMKIFDDKIDNHNYLDFYNFHLSYYLNKCTDGTEEGHLEFIWKVVEEGILNQRRYPYDSISLKRKEKLEDFQRFLRSIDQWAITDCETQETKDRRIRELEKQVAALKEDLANYRIQKKYRINIRKIDKMSIADLLIQLQELKSPEDNETYLYTPAETTWAKIISNFFLENGEDIKFGTVLNYFQKDGEPDETGKPLRKIPIKEPHSLFKLKIKEKSCA